LAEAEKQSMLKTFVEKQSMSTKGTVCSFWGLCAFELHLRMQCCC